MIRFTKGDEKMLSPLLEEITSVSKSSVCKKRFSTFVTNSAYN